MKADNGKRNYNTLVEQDIHTCTTTTRKEDNQVQMDFQDQVQP
jgi:hypothetical protein